MAEPKKKLTSARSGARKSHDALKTSSLNKCQHCGEANRAHLVCKNCGYYRGKKVLKTEKEVQTELKEKEQLKDE